MWWRGEGGGGGGGGGEVGFFPNQHARPKDARVGEINRKNKGWWNKVRAGWVTLATGQFLANAAE